MEDIPPSYESAIARDPWQILASTIPSTELCALIRVSKTLYGVFTPYLWGNPASHFGTEDDLVYIALAKFRKSLNRVRLSVRELTHTLHLPPAQSEIYDRFHPEWLRDVLEQLPNLQSLLVSSLPYFDHTALVSLKSSCNGRKAVGKEMASEFSLRLLIASGCQNTTSQGLAEGLDHFPQLGYLDLSNTLAARSKTVISSLRHLPLLQVLKLRNLQLRDEDVEILAEAIGLRVRSLDLRGNRLTDNSVMTLLSKCFQAPDAFDILRTTGSHLSSTLTAEHQPVECARPDPAVLDEFKDEKYDERLVRRLVSGTMSRLPYEDMPSLGITHLYIADNNLTLAGLASLIRSKRLYVLDVGSLKHDVNLGRPLSRLSTSKVDVDDGHRYAKASGIEQLAAVLAEFGGEITSLRLDHTIITENAPQDLEDTPPRRERHLGLPFPSPADRSRELSPAKSGATPPMYESELYEAPPPFEVPEDSINTALSPKYNRLTPTKESSQSDVECDDTSAPGVIRLPADEPPVPSAAGNSSLDIQATRSVSRSGIPKDVGNGTRFNSASHNDSGTQLASVEKRHQELRTKRLQDAHRLIPGMLPKLRTLTLTDVPSHAESPRVHQALVQFIIDCAFEAELAESANNLKSGRSQRTFGRHSQQTYQNAQGKFALKRIILEVASATTALTSWDVTKPSVTKNTRSSTEDADSEALWSAAENDFTFFDNNEERALPSIETDSRMPCSAVSETPIKPVDSSHTEKPPTPRDAEQALALFDVVHELAQFRKAKKAEYERSIKQGGGTVEGHWPGEVRIVRGHHDVGDSDYYGNLFDATGVYR